jgi:UDP-hydrolysing UDP-N-acetyl-D-glucosamine 2-epimerase
MTLSKGTKRKVCVVLVDRANYGRMKPVMEAIAAHPELELQLVVAGSMVLERFGHPRRLVEEDGFRIDGEVYIELEGSTPSTMAKSVGLGIIEFASEFQRLRPDLMLLIGDRYEALSAAIAGAYMNLCIAHVQGGEVSGSIDESARHAISKFAHYHFPSTQRSADYLVRMGERPDTILSVGCPSSDLAQRMDPAIDGPAINGMGAGAHIDFERPYLLVVFHPTTTEYGHERGQMDELLLALQELEMPTALLWPNIDAGSDHISKSVRVFRTERGSRWMRTLINLDPETYLKVLARTSCAVGNSSSFVRDASYFGTPVVLVGNRQMGREIAENVTPVAPRAPEILAAIRAQLARGRYPASTLYGDGGVSVRIARALAELTPYVQKRLAYVGTPPAGPGGAGRA